MKIAVLTYNVKHRKTYDTLLLLRANGYLNVTVFAQPMTYEKKKYPLLQHRPELNMKIPAVPELCTNLGYEYVEGNFECTITSDFDDSLFLLCGAGILAETFVNKHRIVNSHPGYIPYARGLDSYKWALYYSLPIGVTTHFLGEYVDGGEIIERRHIDINKYDTFHSVAQKLYETEIDMLVNSILLVNEKHSFIRPENDIFKRMPKEIEEELIERFKIGVGFSNSAPPDINN